MKSVYDVVVIGSGFGGAITGCRLAQAGRSVAILERGRRWRPAEFPRSTSEVAKAFWQRGKTSGFLEYRAFKRIDVIQGSGVGGGSLHYFNVTVRAPQHIFERPGWPQSIKRAAMDPYYDLVQDMLDAGPLSPPAGLKLPERTEAFLAAARKAGRPAGLVDIAVYTGPDRENPHGGVPQKTCDYAGVCMLGCKTHSKNTLDLNYIPLAEKNGAEVFPLHTVDKIEPLGEGGYRVHYRCLDPDRPERAETGVVTAGAVVVAAGSLGSTEILLRSKEVHRTLPRISRVLGKRFSGNGDFLLAGTSDADREVNPARGPSITAMADFSSRENSIYIEDLGFPDPFLWFLEGTFPSGSRFRNFIRLAKSYVWASLGGSSGGRFEVELSRLFEGGRTARLLPYLGMGTDAGDGTLRLSRDGSIEIDWSHRASRRLFDEIEEGMRELSRALGGRYVTSPLWRWPFRKLVTAHPLGGCVLGESAEESVVSPYGEVWGHPDLFVADGAIVPTALSVNPSMTIGALAERVAFWMIHGREMRANDPKTPPRGPI